MFIDYQQWRKTVEGVGIDELYRRIDPFDVSHIFNSRWDISLKELIQYPEREAISEYWPMWYHKVRTHNIYI